jgi:hypothetical protein
VRGLKDYSVSQHPVLTRDWLTGRYVTRGLSLRSIAAEAGMGKSTVRRWVKIYRLPAPAMHLPIRMDIAAAAADAPPVLRPAINVGNARGEFREGGAELGGLDDGKAGVQQEQPARHCLVACQRRFAR